MTPPADTVAVGSVPIGINAAQLEHLAVLMNLRQPVDVQLEQSIESFPVLAIGAGVIVSSVGTGVLKDVVAISWDRVIWPARLRRLADGSTEQSGG